MATAITVVCPNCSHRMRASADYVGRKGRCPNCKNLVEIRPGGDESLDAIASTRADNKPTRQRARVATTTVSGLGSGLIAVGATAVLYLVLFWPLRNTFLGELFVRRGPMPFLITLMTCWGMAMLAWKMVKVREQRSFAELELELIPLEIGVEITPDNVDQFLAHLAKLPVAQQRSILGRRIQGALEHFKSRRSVPEVQEYLATQAEIDASGVDGGYTMLRAFIWAVPILGFIGTVLGISTAVSGLDRAIGPNEPPAAAASELPDLSSEPGTDGGATSDRLMQGLGTVTAGLATAFDTTLVALVMAILLLFPTESLRRTEYGMMDGIENFANESLLRRMSDKQSAPTAEELPGVVRDALDSAFREHQRWLAQWQAQVAELGQLIGADFEAVLHRVQQHASEVEETRAQKYQELGRQMEDVFKRAAEAAQHWQQIDRETEERSQKFLDAVGQLHTAMKDNARVCDRLSEQQSRLCAFYSQHDLGPNLGGLAEQMDRLAGRLERAGQEPASAATPVGPSLAPQRSDGPDGSKSMPILPPRSTADESPPEESLATLEPEYSDEKRSGLFGRWFGRRR